MIEDMTLAGLACRFTSKPVYGLASDYRRLPTARAFAPASRIDFAVPASHALYSSSGAPLTWSSENRAAFSTWFISPSFCRSLAYARYADLLWWETSEPDLAEAERFAGAIHREFPGKMLAYNCSPSFNWRKALTDDKIAAFQHEIAQMGYRFQFVTLAGFH